MPPQRRWCCTGSAGVGKSRLAIEHGWREGIRHSAVLHISADTPEALDRNLAGLCGRNGLDLPEKEASEEVVQREAVIAWLQENAGWLLILDGIDSEAGVRAAQKLLPALRGGQVLLTSRLSRWDRTAVQLLEVGALDPQPATEFLLERTADERRREDDDAAGAEEIARELGGLALALEQAGAYINERRLSFRRYLQAWGQEPRGVAGLARRAADGLSPQPGGCLGDLV